MKYTLNFDGQRAISQWLRDNESTDRPWAAFAAAECEFNNPHSKKQITFSAGPLAYRDVLDLQLDWFDSTDDAVALDEVVAMLRRLDQVVNDGGIYPYQDVRTLLARCPKE